MTVLSVKQVRALGDELQRDPLQHANHAVSLLNCIKTDTQEVSVYDGTLLACLQRCCNSSSSGSYSSSSHFKPTPCRLHASVRFLQCSSCNSTSIVLLRSFAALGEGSNSSFEAVLHLPA